MEKEKRLQNLAISYYSRQDIQKAIFQFCLKRETIPRHFDSFGKRPDTLEYPSDILQHLKQGWTSFHCSEELWNNPLELSTNLTEKQLNNLRQGWDLLIDIDSKYLDYSKIAAELIIQALKFHNLRNFGIKFSVSGDTQILIKDKNKIFLIPIQQAVYLIKKGNPLEVLSLDKNKKLKFSKIYDYLEHEDILYEIKHEHSKVPLKATTHHSVFAFEDGKIIEKKVSDLKKGDFLVTFNCKENPVKLNNAKLINNYKLNGKKFSKEVILTKDLMRLIGYYLSEGHITNIINQTGFSFNKKEKGYIKDCIKILKGLTNRRISIRHPNPNSTQILIHAKEWSTFLENLCGKGKNKHLPQFVWAIRKELFLELLKGYIRGDGYKIGGYGIVIKSVAHNLIKELVWLCKLNGISCSLSTEMNKPHKLPQGNMFKGSFVYILKIPKSEFEMPEFSRKRNKFSPYPRDRTFPINGLKKVYYQIKPKMFNYHRKEQMTLNKKRANLERIREVINWFKKFKSREFSEESNKIIKNYESLYNSDTGAVEIKSIKKLGKGKVYDVSVEETEAFFGNDYPILLHNSGSKGFHIIVPWKAFPEILGGQKTKEMFPEWPRTIVSYIKDLINNKLIENISEITIKDRKTYVKDREEAKKVIPDLILVSSRHLFRAPYSLHEKGLASVVIDEKELKNFQPKVADPLRVTIKNFYPQVEENEAKELLISALDWYEEKTKETKIKTQYKEIKIDKSKIVYPPSIIEILKGLQDGRKRALFILLNYFKSLGLDFDDIEKKVKEWNKNNKPPLKETYIQIQLQWHKTKKPVLPPNYDKDYYKGIGIFPTEEELRYKNPVNYTIKKARKT